MLFVPWMWSLLQFCTLVYFLKLLWNKRHIYLLSLKLPGPLALPIIGNGLRFLCKDEDIFQIATDIVAQYSSPMRFWFGPKFTVVFSDVQQVEKIMTSSKFNNKDVVYDFMKEIMGEGLIQSSGERWKRDRKLLAPIFHHKNITCFFPNILEHAKNLVKALQKEEGLKNPFNVEKYLHRCSADIVNDTIVGMKSNAHDGSLDKLLNCISRMYVITHARIVKIWLQKQCLYKYSSYYKEQQILVQYIRQYFKRAVQLGKYNQIKDDKVFLNHMLEIQDNNPEFGGDQELLDHLITLFVASEDTISIISSFALVVIGMYSEIQDKIVEEIHNVVGTDRRSVTMQELPKLKYLEMALKDILRLFPIAPFIIRKTYEDCKVDDFRIPAGCSVIVSIQNIHRDPVHWEQPNEFYPEHFLPEAIRKRHPYAYLPFSAGPRMCLGKTFAYLAIKTILVTVLQHYVLESDGQLSDIQLRADISVRMKNNFYPVMLKHRM